MRNVSILITCLFSMFSAQADGFSPFCHRADLMAKASNNELHPRRRSRFLGCQRDTKWMQQTRQVLCKNEDVEIELPRVFFFSFDGAADFNPQRALSVDPSIPNLDGEENSDLNIGNFNGGAYFLEEIKYMAKDVEYESRYYAGSGLQMTENYNKAFRCLKHIDFYLDELEKLDREDYIKPIFTTIGYSNGGIDALNLQHDSPNRFDRRFDIAVTVDPIAKALLYHPSKLREFIGEKNERTGVLFNFYQDIDYKSLGEEVTIPYVSDFYFGFKFKGKKVFNADINHYFNEENHRTMRDWDGAYAHIIIVRSNTIWSTMRCELDQRLNNSDRESTLSCQRNKVLTY